MRFRLLQACLLLGTTLGAAHPLRAETPTLAAADQRLADGKFDDARKDYERLVKADPQTVAPRLGLVRALLRLDQWPDAIKVAQSAVQAFPRDPNTHGLLALALMRAGQPGQAGDEAKAALALDKDNYWGLIAAGRVADWDGHDKEGLAFFQRATTLRPDDPDGWLGLLLTSDDSRSMDEELPLARTYLKLNPQGQPHSWNVEWAQTMVANESDYWRGFQKDGDRPYHLETPDPPNSTYTTQFPIERQGNYVLLPVQINGQTFHLLFDTGAGDDILLSRKAAERLHLPVLAKSYVRGVQGRAAATRHKADTLTLGTVAMRSIPLEVADNVGDLDGCDGLFGGAILDDYAITLDFGANTMTLSRGRNAHHLALPNTNTATMPLHVFHKYLYVSTRAGGHQCWAMLDTGAYTDILSLRSARQLTSGLSHEFMNEFTVRGRVGVGDSNMSFNILQAPQKVNFTFDQSVPPCRLTQEDLLGESPLDQLLSPQDNFEVGMLLGVPLLALHSRVTIDYPHGLLTFEDPNPEPPKPGS